ncbi:MarR family transcriptional regulator [Kitasatospora sp. NPDC054939]
MAQPGYGKRSAPGQSPRSRADFAQLPVREQYLAHCIDRLPDGAAMDAKTLAKEQPLYGQQAVRSALNALSAAGHLRRVRERVADRSQWASRTYFSRAPRPDAWWNAFLATGEVLGDVHAEVHAEAGEVHPDEAAAHEQQAEPPASDDDGPSPGYTALARLGLADGRLVLSAAECAALAPLAAEWFARGSDQERFTRTLTAGLPPEVHSPAALVRTRLTTKLPPALPTAAETPEAPQAVQQPAAAARPTALQECTDCRAPARPHALLGGLCRACREPSGRPVPDLPAAAGPDAVRTRVAELRATARRGGEVRRALFGGGDPSGGRDLLAGRDPSWGRDLPIRAGAGTP